MSNPWMKFYPQDWQGDEGLQMASLAARGLWIEMLCIMHKNSGYLSIGNQPVTNSQLAIKVGVSVEQVTDLISELEVLNVFSRTRSSVIYSRRMLTDLKKAQIAKKNGKNGGNPTLGNIRDIPPSVNPPDKLPDIPPKIPETRSLEDKRKKIPKKEVQEFEDFWKLCPRKVGKGAAEQKYWVARQETSQEVLIASMKAHAKEMADRETEFVPHPSTWLSQKRYFDESAEATQELAKKDWQPWQQEIAARLGDNVVKAWFSTPKRKGNALVFPNKFSAEKVKSEFMAELSKIGIVEILHE